MPVRDDIRILDVECGAGRLRLTCGGQAEERSGPRAMSTSVDGSARQRRFLADYEAKALYAATEKLIDDGQLERAIAHYQRQLEIHPDQSFLVTRLLQLQTVHRASMPEAGLLARHRLEGYGDDLDALTTLAVMHWRRDDVELAAESFERIAQLAEARGDVIDGAQARCAVATVLAESDRRPPECPSCCVGFASTLARCTTIVG